MNVNEIKYTIFSTSTDGLGGNRASLLSNNNPAVGFLPAASLVHIPTVTNASESTDFISFVSVFAQ
jgi:hypothetical protein